MNTWIKKSTTVLSACFASVCLIYLIFCAGRIGNGYLPFWTDEFMYLSDINSFLLTGDIGTSFIYNEGFSKIWDIGHHGFAYTLYDSFLTKIFGLGETANVVYVNLLTFAFSLFIIASLPRVEKSQKIMLAALYCSNCVIVSYLFTYMQEINQLPIALLATCLLFKIYVVKENLKFSVSAFIILILLASFFRPNWVFWLVGLIPLANTWREAILFSISYIFINLLALAAFPLINGVYPVGFLQTLTDIVTHGEIFKAALLLIKHFIYNVFKYVSQTDDPNWGYTLSNWIPLAGLIFFLYASKSEFKKFYFAVLLIIGINLCALLLLYDVHDWREVRMMSASVYLIFAALVFTKQYPAVLALLVLQILVGAVNYHTVERVIAERQSMYRLFTSKGDLCRELKALDHQITAQETPTILLQFEEFYGDGLPYVLCLPLQNVQGTRLRYSVNLIRKENEVDLRKIDYYITQQPVESDSFEQTYQTDFFKLYKVRKPLPFTTTTDKSNY